MEAAVGPFLFRTVANPSWIWYMEPLLPLPLRRFCPPALLGGGMELNGVLAFRPGLLPLPLALPELLPGPPPHPPVEDEEDEEEEMDNVVGGAGWKVDNWPTPTTTGFKHGSSIILRLGKVLTTKAQSKPRLVSLFSHDDDVLGVIRLTNKSMF